MTFSDALKRAFSDGKLHYVTWLEKNGVKLALWIDGLQVWER